MPKERGTEQEDVDGPLGATLVEQQLQCHGWEELVTRASGYCKPSLALKKTECTRSVSEAQKRTQVLMTLAEVWQVRYQDYSDTRSEQRNLGRLKSHILERVR